MSGRPAPAPRPNLPAPTHQCLDSGQTRESTEIPRHWPRQVSAASAAPVTSYMLSFAQPIACPMRSAPFAAPCPVPRPSRAHTHAPVYLAVPCVLVVHCFTIALAPSSWYLIHRGTDMLVQDGLGFSARRSPTASRSGCHAMARHHHHGSCSASGSSHGHSELAQNFLVWRNP